MLIFYSNAGNPSVDDQCSILDEDACNQILKNNDKNKSIYCNECKLLQLNSSFKFSICCNGDICNSGSAINSRNTWIENITLYASDYAEQDHFGDIVSITDGFTIAGANFVGTESGACIYKINHVFEQIEKLVPLCDYFRNAESISDNYGRKNGNDIESFGLAAFIGAITI